MAAYRGVDVGFTAAGFAVSAGASHTTPTLGTTRPAWVISYWADKSSDGTTLTPPRRTDPPGLLHRHRRRPDHRRTHRPGSAIPAGTVGGLTALGTPNSSRAATFTTTLVTHA